ncbi:phosphogluconate dehydratase [Catenovulum agarivorans DS-2]|uniref:Phosphogluconate dehydratase n=1 Tax=Catenovulum agarivorans DS-2 TaxID=1328313 RepID=W7QK78_9ALTE|nr:phosphogluconate dehydratase [Catenovulum agarivorans]EWH12311.1 phosphogluconate dehydratase [Catenovulum agarivorans DS-2]
MNSIVQEVTERVIERSKETRQAYLNKVERARIKGPHREVLSCGNLAHGYAACAKHDKNTLKQFTKANVGIITSYNDMLSAHQPYEHYPKIIKEAIAETGSVAQVAGGVPAMCDGVTQGQPGMDLSLLSRDVIAMASCIGLSHNMFDGALMLGICDKIVPGLVMASLSFGHLPFVFIPAGPMPSGIPNSEKTRVRMLYAEGKIGKEALLESESASYHSAGTCTFYGTANSNQLVVEMMGLHLPGSSFVETDSVLRHALTRAAAKQVTRITHLGNDYTPISKIVDEKSVINGIISLLATGGSTNHTMHLVAMARAAGIIVDWNDFSDLSNATPLMTRIYPNGTADINHFHQAGGMAVLFKELLDADILHNDVHTVCGQGLEKYTKTPVLQDGELVWVDEPTSSKDLTVIASAKKPFKPNGGLQVLTGNLGRSVMKTSSLPEGDVNFTAPAKVFESQHALEEAFKQGELEGDFVAVVRFQGPKAIGMPELHKLTPPLGVLQDRGQKVALVTDGRMSGASGKVPAAIHMTPEAIDGGLIAKVKDGDMMLVDSANGKVELLVDQDELDKREAAIPQLVSQEREGMGREFFGSMRSRMTGAEEGACCLFYQD